MSQEKVIDALNVQLANLHIVNYKLHNYHWNVTGLQFFGVHEMTESFYDHFFKLFDDVAERILQLEGKPLATVAAYLKTATLVEDTETSFTAVEVLKAVLADFKKLLAEAKVISKLADGDAPTQAMEDDFTGWLEKAIWMLNHSLK